MKPTMPLPIPCEHEHCGAKFVGSHCPTCKEPRSTYLALLNITRKAAPAVRNPKPYPACKYQPAALCVCDGAGLCLETC